MNPLILYTALIGVLNVLLYSPAGWYLCYTQSIYCIYYYIDIYLKEHLKRRLFNWNLRQCDMGDPSNTVVKKHPANLSVNFHAKPKKKCISMRNVDHY